MADFQQGDRVLIRYRRVDGWEPATYVRAYAAPGFYKHVVKPDGQSQRVLVMDNGILPLGLPSIERWLE